MKDLDLENLKKVNELVRTHFYLNESSKETFTTVLLNDSIRKENYIDDTILNLVGDDLRLRLPLDKSQYEVMDKGWEIYKNTFSLLVNEFEISYNDFRANKIKVKNQEFKLFKFTKKWYTETRERMSKLYRNFRFGTGNDLSIEVLTEYIEDRITTFLEKVSKFKLGKKKLEIVLTANFADWFLCSTGESWNSCLSLESDYDGCFWSGLPGLIVDKNRFMIYITDGSKKTYQGIQVDKFMQRSWGILLEDEESILSNQYPQTLADSRFLSNVFPDLNLLRTTLANGVENVVNSRHLINLLTNESGNTVFIYQDGSIFEVENYRSKTVSIRSGYSGFHNINKHEELTEESRYRYSDGLSELIRNKNNLGSYEEDFVYCCECSEEIIDSEQLTSPDGDTYCENCYNELFTECYECGKILSREDGCVDPDGDIYCESCYNELFAECEECGEIKFKSELEPIDDKNLCEDCCIELSNECTGCNTTFLNTNLIKEDDNLYCEHCHSHLFSECEKCGILFKDSNENKLCSSCKENEKNEGSKDERESA